MAGFAIPIGGASTYTARQDRQSASGLWLPGATGLQVRPGVRPGAGLDVTLVGTTITVTAGTAVVQSAASAIAGAYRAWLDASATLTLTAANSSNPRVDLVYLRVRDTDEDGSGFRDCAPQYVVGTAAASPSAPTIPGGTSGVVLALISVPKSGTGSPTVSYTERQYTVASGGILPVTSATEIASGGLYTGQTRYNTLTNVLETWTGTVWRPQGAFNAFTPVWAASSIAPILGNGAFRTMWSRVGDIVTWWGDLTLGSTTNGGSGIWTFTIPVPSASGAGIPTARGSLSYFRPGDQDYIGTCLIIAGDTVLNMGTKTNTSSGSFSNVSNTSPAAATANSVVTWSISYRAVP
jgi:hypothetical protein